MAEARRRDTALARRSRRAAKFEDSPPHRELDKRLQTLTPQVAALRTEQQTQVQDMAVPKYAPERRLVLRDAGPLAVAQLQDAPIHESMPAPP